MVRLAEAVQPLAFVAMTVRAVVAFTIRETLAVVAPLFHRYEAPPEAVKVAGLPGQTELGPLKEMAGTGWTVTVPPAVAEQPPPLETVTT
jgi:hypothetical protein